MAKKIKGERYGDIFTSEMIAYYQGNICDFVEDIIFGNDPNLKLSHQQKELLESIQSKKRISAKSGKGIGKTSGLSWGIFWFLCCFSNPKIICSAPAYPTLKSGLWTELSLWLEKSVVLSTLFEITERKLFLKEKPKTWYCEPRTARDKESMQGLHAENMLIVVDEASGLMDEIFEALDTTLTGKNNKIVLIGNPTQITGPFYESFHKFKKRWSNHTFNAEDAPYPLRNDEQIEYFGEKYGREHNLYKVNILGEFPTGNVESFLELSDIMAAVERDTTGVGEIELGVDVARYGDDSTVVYWRHGYKVYPAKTMAKSSIPEVVQLVFNTVNEARAKTGYEGRIRVKVDDSGLGGGCTDLLMLDRQHNIEVIACNFGGAGDNQYHNEASKMWGKVRDVLHLMDIPNDSNLIEELSARRWGLSNSGKIQIEPKSVYKKEYGNSPDRADAFVLCWASKVGENTVLKSFDPLDKNTIVENPRYIGETRVASVFVTSDMYSYVVYCGWDGSKLTVYDEYHGDDSLFYLAATLKSHAEVGKIIGNDRMFGTVGNDLSSKFRKFGVRVRENYRYDELGSIESLNTIVGQRRLVVHSKCIKTIDQLAKWQMQGSKIQQEKDFGLCYALCNVLSLLKKEIKERVDSVYIPPVYSRERVSERQDLKTFARGHKPKRNSWLLN